MFLRFDWHDQTASYGEQDVVALTHMLFSHHCPVSPPVTIDELLTELRKLTEAWWAAPAGSAAEADLAESVVNYVTELDARLSSAEKLPAAWQGSDSKAQELVRTIAGLDVDGSDGELTLDAVVASAKRVIGGTE